jgi:branched-chain amino acid transport system permease protein
MNTTIATYLMWDGLTNGAIYALLGLALVLVFAVTRVIFLPQGEFVAFGALTYAVLETGKFPGTAPMLMLFGGAAFLLEIWVSRHVMTLKSFLKTLALYVLLPAVIWLITKGLVSNAPQKITNLLLTLMIIAPMGIYVYRLAFEPIMSASVLTLFIVSIGTHLALMGVGLYFFGPEGLRANALIDGSWGLLKGQAMAIFAVTLGFMLFLWFFFAKTILGKALHATAVNRIGARLQGIKTSLAGKIAFVLASIMGAVSGILIVPATTIYYDSGFLIGLKGFVAAIIGGLISYPLTFIAALVVGLTEGFSSFYASNYKEIIVFTLLLPVLIWRSFTTHHEEEEE